MHYLIIMSACVVSLERTFAHPSPGEKLIFPNGRPRNMTLEAVRNAYPPKAPGRTENSGGAGPESIQDLAADKDKFGYIMYAGRIFSALNSDPRYNEMKEKLKNPESRNRIILEFLEVMSNTTRTKLDQIKAEEVQKYMKKCESQKDGTEPSKPDYIDMQHPEKFSMIDFSQVITKFASMQSLMEKLMGGHMNLTRLSYCPQCYFGGTVFFALTIAVNKEGWFQTSQNRSKHCQHLLACLFHRKKVSECVVNHFLTDFIKILSKKGKLHMRMKRLRW